MYEDYTIEFSKEKDAWLEDNRFICFSDISVLIESKAWLKIIKKHNPERYPKQDMFLFEINEEIYCVPFVVDQAKKEVFLKTIYPSRKMRKQYLES